MTLFTSLFMLIFIFYDLIFKILRDLFEAEFLRDIINDNVNLTIRKVFMFYVDVCRLFSQVLFFYKDEKSDLTNRLQFNLMFYISILNVFINDVYLM